MEGKYLNNQIICERTIIYSKNCTYNIYTSKLPNQTVKLRLTFPDLSTVIVLLNSRKNKACTLSGRALEKFAWNLTNPILVAGSYIRLYDSAVPAMKIIVNN